MFEKFPEQNNSDIEERKEVQNSHSEFVRERLADPDLSEEQRKALREILINSGIKISMYEQFQNSVQSEGKVIEMKSQDEDENEEEYKKAV